MEKQFIEWVASIKKNYQQSQIKAAIRVNSELIAFYFNLGKEISESDFKREYVCPPTGCSTPFRLGRTPSRG